MLSHEFHLEVASDAYFGKGTDIAFKVVVIKQFVPDCSAWLFACEGQITIPEPRCQALDGALLC